MHDLSMTCRLVILPDIPAASRVKYQVLWDRPRRGYGCLSCCAQSFCLDGCTARTSCSKPVIAQEVQLQLLHAVHVELLNKPKSSREVCAVTHNNPSYCWVMLVRPTWNRFKQRVHANLCRGTERQGLEVCTTNAYSKLDHAADLPACRQQLTCGGQSAHPSPHRPAGAALAPHPPLGSIGCRASQQAVTLRCSFSQALADCNNPASAADR